MSRACDRRLLAISLAALGLLGFVPPATSAARASAAHGTHPARDARAPRSSSSALSPAAATGALSLDLLHTLGSGNLVFSPDNIATALAMVGTGAAGETAAQISAALHLSPPAAFAGVGALQRKLVAEQGANGQAEAPTLDTANGLFLQEGFTVEPPFLTRLRESFGAAPRRVDFVHRNPEAVRTINAWVSARTQGLIPELFASLEPTTQLVLADAIYLKAEWSDPFSGGRTAPEPFYGPGQSSTVPFMNQTESIPYGKGEGWTAVELPYRSSTLSLLVVLPNGSSLASLEHRLDPILLERIAHSVRPTRVSLSIPRIHLTLKKNLKETLAALGVTDAFTDRADFSRIAPAALKIGVVEHAADLRIDEAGTVAAAATGVGVTYVISSPRRAPVRFDADRPFLFFLRDDRTGAVLFAGRLLNAATAQG